MEQPEHSFARCIVPFEAFTIYVRMNIVCVTHLQFFFFFFLIIERTLSLDEFKYDSDHYIPHLTNIGDQG